MNLKQTFDKLANDYVKCFIKNYFTFSDGSQLDGYWVADEPGGMLEVGDYYFNYDTIRFCVDYDVDYDTLIKWYDYCLRVGMLDQSLPTPNIKFWVKGCLIYDENELEKLEKIKTNIEAQKEELKECINNLKQKGI